MTTSAPSPRQGLVDTARSGWITRLIDLSRRNNLLYFRALKAGTLDLAPAPTEVMAELLCGDLVTLRRLLPEATDEVYKQRSSNLLGIWRQAVGNLEERGLDTLYLALGGATWPSADGGRPPAAAVFLIPLVVELRGRDGANIALRRAGDVQVNAVLLHVLEVEHGIRVDPETIVEVLEGDDAGELFNLQPAFDRLRGFCARIPGFAVEELRVVGNFSFQKMAIVRDLQEQGASLASHQLIAALCGDMDARQAISSVRKEIDPGSLDLRPADDEFMVLDADSSQQTVVVSALQGQDGVIQGPPGTGKSQTIANLIAELAARGKRVLFVAEKRAALEVVRDRLGRAGLGHLVLDLHGADISRRQLMANIASTLQVIGDSRPPDADAVHRSFQAARQRLVDHVTQLHGTRTEAGVSVYDLQAMLLRLPPQAASQTRWRGATLGRLGLEAREEAEGLLAEAATTAPLFLGDSPSPWNGAALDDGHAAQAAVDVATRLANVRLPAVTAAASRLAAAGGLPVPRALGEIEGQASLAEAVGAMHQSYPGLFEGDLDALEVTLAPAASTLSRLWATITSSAFRGALSRLEAMAQASRSPAEMLRDVTQARRLATSWRALAPRAAVKPLAEAAELRRALADWSSDHATLTAAVTRPWSDAVADRQADYAALAADRLTPLRIPRLRAIDRALQAGGWGDLVAEIRARKPDPSGWPTLLQHAWATSHLEKAWADNPELATFDGKAHGTIVERFRDLDRQRVRLAVERVRRAHGLSAVRAMNERPEAAALVRRESQKKTRHLPFRSLVKEAGPVLTALKPCWMASPLSVSQLLPASQDLFDIVLFDEASQVLPEDAVTSLLRARHAVVAGDRHQLPPTTFFAAGDEDLSGDADERTATEGFESLLDLMSAFCTPWSLDWHYRSRDESLIAFSNRHIYGERLVTFPSPGGGARVMRHELVSAAPAAEGDDDSSAAEIERVVELVLDHARLRPAETLGVIAMGLEHAVRLQAAVDAALRAHPELDAFFEQSRPERFFIKNLERVQGDERDAIILTIGYGKDRSGKLPYRFGPLLYEGGERRLNVAITRARHRLTLVSSFSHLDMDPSRTKNRGVELLRLYLEYAAAEGGASRVTASDLASTPLEDDVLRALTARGIPLSPRWGASRFRIDLVARHPSDPSRHVLAVECDGATYEAAPTARDRDRLRPQHLEGLGWSFHRIWSTDWYLRQEQEIERAWAAYQAAIVSSDAAAAAATAAAAAVPTLATPAPAPPAEPVATAAPVDPRGPGPRFARRGSIAEYRPFELAEVARWVASDGRLRTDDEWLEEAADQLGFRRIGPRIEATLRKTIATVREEKPPPDQRG